MDKYVIATGAVGDTVYRVYKESTSIGDNSFLGEDLRCGGTIQIVSKSSIKYSTNHVMDIWHEYDRRKKEK